jgi:hypothetical protein
VRLPIKRRLGITAIAILCVAAPAPPLTAREIDETVTPGWPAIADIDTALAKVKADPNLAADRTVKTLRWRDSTTQRSGMPPWLSWIAGLFRWMSESARALMWVAVAALIGVLLVFFARLLRGASLNQPKHPLPVPTHVGDVDIRPETLPDDIGAAARALWDRGEHRAALALLYRGLLSRLAHVHRIPIRDSTTEGDCLTLTSGSQLSETRREYVSQLVRVWQRAVYGREDVQAATVHLLCKDFGAALDPLSPGDRAANRGAA